jgi:hypothetical protein
MQAIEFAGKMTLKGPGFWPGLSFGCQGYLILLAGAEMKF